MDAASKAKIRKRAKARFVRSVIAFCVLSALFYGLRYLQKIETDPSHTTQLALEGKAVRLNNEFARFYMDRPRRLIECPPPANGGSLLQWAAAIQKTIGQPAAVYLRTGRTFTWVDEPDELADGIALAKPSFYADSVAGNRDHPDRRGTMLVSHWSVPRNLGNPDWQVWMVGPADDSVRWGVVLHTADSWPAFFQRLARPPLTRSAPVDFDDPAFALGNELALPSSASARYLVTIRAYDEAGHVLFASPGLDTTHVMYRSDSRDGRVVEFYQSRLDALQDQAAARARLPWFVVCFPLIMIIPVYRWYHQVRRLTEPEPPVAETATPTESDPA